MKNNLPERSPLANISLVVRDISKTKQNMLHFVCNMEIN